MFSQKWEVLQVLLYHIHCLLCIWVCNALVLLSNELRIALTTWQELEKPPHKQIQCEKQQHNHATLWENKHFEGESVQGHSPLSAACECQLQWWKECTKHRAKIHWSKAPGRDTLHCSEHVYHWCTGLIGKDWWRTLKCNLIVFVYGCNATKKDIWCLCCLLSLTEC